ncbi:MAG: hypothetical protein IKL65_06175 [Bacilli bacterium]|nr:hypothetical protein [Bacilli bacterium]
MELKQEELDKVLAGNLQGMSEESALNNPNLFRDKQIEELKKEKARLENLNSKELVQEEVEKAK